MDHSVPVAESPPEVPPPVSVPAEAQGTTVTVAKNSFWLLIDALAGLVTSFYCSIMVARGLGPDRMGEYNYVLWFVSVLKMLTDVAIPQTFRKFAAEFMGRGDYVTLKTMVRVVLRLQVKLVFLGVATGLVIVQVFFRSEQKQLASLAVLTLVPSLLLSVPAGVLYGTENLRHNVLGSVVAMAVNVAGVTLALILHGGLVAIVGSLLASRVVDCALRFYLFGRQARRMPGEALDKLDPALRVRLIRFAALQLLPTLLYSLLFDRMEVVFLKSLAPTREIAFFSISFTLAQYMLIPPQTLATSASVTMMVKQGRAPAEAAQLAASATWLTILFGAPMLFGVAALADPLLRLLYGAKYLPAIPVLTIMAIFAVSLAASQSAQHLLVAAEKQVFYIVWLLVCAGLDVAGCLLLIPSLGALGAAYAKGISQVVAAAGFLGFMVWQFRVKLPYFRMVKLIAACAAMFAGVSLVGRELPSLLALLVGVPLGVAIFVLLTRWFRCLDKVDRDRLGSLARMVPARLRGPYLAVVSLLVPARAEGT